MSYLALNINNFSEHFLSLIGLTGKSTVIQHFNWVQMLLANSVEVQQDLGGETKVGHSLD